MQIIILESGTEGKTLNAFREKPNFYAGNTVEQATWRAVEFNRKLEQWQRAEESRKVYEIAYGVKKFKTEEHRISLEILKLQPGTIYEAELLSNGKIKIIS